ncbi:MAG: hypothetical protein JGK33_26845 [Microcoleus sp. PH2017_11_PCY_U_A]|uniref:hypothetical protein n=1 Tax=Microcoleus sp. PH2017_11_PCY_U_A TaxID=2798822 RepID=UPI001D8DAF87|nr:hypothetical protein [Microcoleus sp. PH2017_11_PCY_U_A]MCC3463207.1 hypothetical protein [Microcoleus sp. PH2017_11_PCY_U_A]
MSYSQHFRLLQNLFYKTFLVSLDSLCLEIRSPDCRFDRPIVGRLSVRSPDCRFDRPIVGSIARLSVRSPDCRFDRINDVAID